MALTGKQRAFVSAYVIHKNATKAAIEAGYSQKTAHSMGWENLRKPEIVEEIEKAFEALTMTAGEALARMTEHARGDIGDFIGLTEDEIRNHPSARIVKKYKRTRRTERGKDNQPGATVEVVELELYDAQSALKEILDRTMGRPTQHTELTGKDGGDLVFEFVEVTSNANAPVIEGDPDDDDSE